jgi:inhibitor of cysteine peptidase
MVMCSAVRTLGGLSIARIAVGVMLLFVPNVSSAYDEMNKLRDTLTITERNSGDTVNVALGTIVILNLETIPGTGYAWHVDPAKPTHLRAIGKPVFLSKKIDTTKTAMGAAAHHVFRYRAAKEGTEVLAMSYRRAWEKNKPPLKTFSITISIHR